MRNSKWDGTSYIDITVATEDLAKEITGWKVLPGKTFSVHGHISFSILGQSDVGRPTGPKELLDLRRCRDLIRRRMVENREEVRSVEALTKALQGIKRQAYCRGRQSEWETPYWWSMDIEEAWTRCNAARRAAARAPRAPRDQRELLLDAHKAARTSLKKMIRRSKRAQ